MTAWGRAAVLSRQVETGNILALSLWGFSFSYLRFVFEAQKHRRSSLLFLPSNHQAPGAAHSYYCRGGQREVARRHGSQSLRLYYGLRFYNSWQYAELEISMNTVEQGGKFTFGEKTTTEKETFSKIIIVTKISSMPIPGFHASKGMYMFKPFTQGYPRWSVTWYKRRSKRL